MAEPRVIYEGSTEPLEVEISSRTTLDAQVVSFSFDEGASWKVATAVGAAAKLRTYTLTVSAANLPTFPFDTILKVTRALGIRFTAQPA